MKLLRRLWAARHVAGWRIFVVAPLWSFHRRFLVFEHDLRSGEDLSDDAIVGELADEAAFAELPLVNPMLKPSTIERRRAEGLSCWVARLDGRVVHYRWYAGEPAYLPFVGLTWEPATEGEYMGMDAFTHPDARGIGIHAAMNRQHIARRWLGVYTTTGSAVVKDGHLTIHR